MGLCGGFRCGCGVTSTPAVEGAINGELPSILVSGSGEPLDPFDLQLNDAWAAEVAKIGVVGYTEITANFGGFVATQLTVMETTFVADPNRTYVTTISGDLTSSVGGDIIVLAITDSANVQLTRFTDRMQAASVAQSYEKSLVESGLSGSTTRRLRASRAAGTGTCDVNAGANFPAFIVVRDIGPA